MPSRETLLIIDANHLLHRVSHVPSLIGLETKTGKKFGGVYGFLRCLKKALDERIIWRCVAVWDGGLSTRRLDILPSYKAARRPIQGEEVEENYFGLWRAYLEEILPMLSVSSVRLPGREGDDLIWQVREAWWSRGKRWCGVLSEDRDFIQMVDDHTYLYFPVDDRCIQVGGYEEHKGIPRDRFLLYRCLVGDKSDCIPGIPGVGDNTAKIISIGVDSTDLDTVRAFCEASYNKRVKSVLNHMDIIERNHLLMSLGEEKFKSHELDTIRNAVGHIPIADFDGVQSLFASMEFDRLSRGFYTFIVPFQRLHAQAKESENRAAQIG